MDCVMAILAKTGPFVKIHRPGFAILAPAIFKMAVGNIFLARVIDKIALLMLCVGRMEFDHSTIDNKKRRMYIKF